MTDPNTQITAYLPDGVEIHVSPAWLYDHLRLQILGANEHNLPKFERAAESITRARVQGDLDAKKCDALDRMVAAKRRELAARVGD